MTIVFNQTTLVTGNDVRGGIAMSEKASFYSRDPGETASIVEDAAGKKIYKGAERRRDNRRQASDRRTEVRFDLTKEDRRKNPGRREDDKTPDFW